MRLPPKQISTRSLETRIAPSAVHTGRGIFWREIRGGETCTPHQENTRRKLHSHNRVVPHKIHQNYNILGLQAKTSASFTNSIHLESSQTVQPQTKEKKPNHTQASLSNMDPKNNMSHNHNQRHFLTKRERNLFNKCADFFLFIGRSVNSTLL